MIGGNPLRCDCDLLWLKELFDTREYLLKYIEIERSKFVPLCESPDGLRGETWDVLGDEAFGCGSRARSRSSAQSPSKVRVVRLEDLSFKVRDVGSTHMRLEWHSFKRDAAAAAEKPAAEGREPRKVSISCHPFGRRKERVTATAQLSVGTHRLKGLQPSTAYVVCISLAEGTQAAGASRDDCVEVVTKDDEQVLLQDVYKRIGVVALAFALLMLKCCCTTSIGGFQKNVTSMRKNS